MHLCGVLDSLAAQDPLDTWPDVLKPFSHDFSDVTRARAAWAKQLRRTRHRRLIRVNTSEEESCTLVDIGSFRALIKEEGSLWRAVQNYLGIQFTRC